MKYARITCLDGAKFILRVTSETEKFVSGIEVDREGDEVVPVGFHNRLRIVERALIKKITPMRLNNTYATLEVCK